MNPALVLPALEAELEKQCAGLAGPMFEVCRYAVQGGRRIRAALLLSAAPPGDPQRALEAAAALEIMHAATLLQDDIFDDGHVRRGRSTAHLRFGKALTILASDWLLIRSLELAASIDPVFFQRLAQAGTAMAQAVACELNSPVPRSLDHAQQLVAAIAREKTATLFGVCLCGAAILHGFSPSQCARWQQIGIDLGITYQLIDDCVDLYSDESTAGKSTGCDVIAGRLTLPVLLAVDALRMQHLVLSPERLQAGRLTPLEASLLQTALHSTEIKTHLHQLVRQKLCGHRHEALNAGLGPTVVDMLLPDFEAKLTVCFPSMQMPEQQARDTRPLALAGAP